VSLICVGPCVVCRVYVCMYCDRTCRLEKDFYFESFFVVRRLSCVDVRRSRLMKDDGMFIDRR